MGANAHRYLRRERVQGKNKRKWPEANWRRQLQPATHAGVMPTPFLPVHPPPPNSPPHQVPTGPDVDCSCRIVGSGWGLRVVGVGGPHRGRPRAHCCSGSIWVRLVGCHTEPVPQRLRRQPGAGARVATPWTSHFDVSLADKRRVFG